DDLVAGKGLSQQARKKAAEGKASRCLHLEDQRLTLMQNHAARPAYRLETPFRRQLPLIERMTGFVDHAHQGVRGFVFAIACSYPYIACPADAEGMWAFIEPAMFELKAKLLHDPPGRRLLGRNRKMTIGFDRPRLRALPL